MTLVDDPSDRPPITGQRSYGHTLPVSLRESLSGVVKALQRQRLAVRIAPGEWGCLMSRP